jgi:enediyne biosynthesis protein E4
VTKTAGIRATHPEYGPLWSVGGVWLDYNNDGHLDLLVLNYLAWSEQLEKTCQGYCHPEAYGPLPNTLYKNRGDGTFTDVSKETGIGSLPGKAMGAAQADFNGDGWPDIFVTNDKMANFLFMNEKGIRFREVALEAGVAFAQHGMEISGMGADARDVDGDGHPDIFFVALERESFPLFRNNGKGAFIEITNRTGLAHASELMAGYGPVIADFDNDGRKDLFVSRGHVQAPEMSVRWQIDQHNTLFWQSENGRFAALTAEAGFTEGPQRRHRGVAFADLNNNGRLDLVVTALEAEAQLWRNQTSNGNHWVAFRLRGHASNRDGIGAVIRLKTAAGMQVNHMTSGGGYASSSLVPVHFGLGKEEVADTVEIRWPSGKVQRLTDVRADQVLLVDEPQ